MKKLDIAAIITGVSSLILCVLFFLLFVVTGARAFQKDGGPEKIKEFVGSAKEKIVEFTGNGDFVNVHDGNDQVSIGPDGIFITSDDDKVVVSPTGIYVNGGNDTVSVGVDGVKISDASKEESEKTEEKIEETTEDDIPVIG